MPSIS